jgi:hypothetical protein
MHTICSYEILKDYQLPIEYIYNDRLIVNFKFFIVYTAAPTWEAPASSILFLAIDHISKFGVPTLRAWQRVVLPIIPIIIYLKNLRKISKLLIT